MAYITTARTGTYTDLDFAMKANPNIEYDVAVMTDSAAIRQSILNILRTNHGEKPFDPLFGANLQAYLFENVDYITAAAISNDIDSAIRRDEPRVNIINVQVRARPDNNAVHITVTVEVLSTQQLIDIESSIERLR